MTSHSDLTKRRANGTNHAGLSLIEVVISIVLVASVLLVSLAASANLMRNSHERRDTNQGQQLATQFLDEVTAMAFRDLSEPTFGLESGELLSDRTTFDDVDDYANYQQSPPTHRDGTAISSYEGWTISVGVVAADIDNDGISTSAATNDSPLRRVTVFCQSPDGVTTTATAIVANVGDDSEETTSFEQWRRVRLTFPGREVDVVSPLRNAPDPTYEVAETP
ncbi:MAG: type IV pilus modification PilV family protein [Rubripirellula sp.]